MHPAPLSLSPTPAFPPENVSALTDNIQESFQIAMASTATLASEPSVYLSGLVRDLVEASGRIVASRNPFEALAAQQSYAMARGIAWLDSAFRCFERCVTDQASPKHEPGHLVVTD